VTAGFVSDTLASARQMEHVVTNLLALARMESKLASIRIEPIDVAEVLAGIRPCLGERIAARKLRLDWQVPAQALVRTDAVLCRSILFNLLDNAVEYTPKGESVLCQLARGADGWMVVLSNPAGDLTPEDLAHLFEPLWRKEGARSVHGHAGLGLAVAQAFAQALSMRLSAQVTKEGQFEVCLWMPVVIST
jgi:K+-sensing histidine kinase KdpD